MKKILYMVLLITIMHADQTQKECEQNYQEFIKLTASQSCKDNEQAQIRLTWIFKNNCPKVNADEFIEAGTILMNKIGICKK